MRMAMMAMTTRSSMSVKATRARENVRDMMPPDKKMTETDRKNRMRVNLIVRMLS